MKAKLGKYFWSYSKKSVEETAKILKNPEHRFFRERLITLMSRCDKPRELFKIVPEDIFLEG